MPGEFVGGALNFKGDKTKIKKKKRTVKHEVLASLTETTTIPEVNHNHHNKTNNKDGINYHQSNDESDHDDGLTEVERKALRRRLERERLDAETMAQKSHRERIEEFNGKLASQTELNDIPRVSAAGNG